MAGGMTFIRIVGLDECIDAIHKLTPAEQSNAYRRAVRAGGKVFQAGLKDTARSMHGGGSNVPLSFQKVPAPKVTTRGGDSGRDIESRVRPSSPLFNIFEPGAGSHPIQADTVLRDRPAAAGGCASAQATRRLLLPQHGAPSGPQAAADARGHVQQARPGGDRGGMSTFLFAAAGW